MLYSLPKYPLLLLLITFLFSCKKEEVKMDIVQEDQIVVVAEVDTFDVAYGMDESQTLNYYLPEGFHNETPMLILIHGGGWQGGDKNEIHRYQLMVKESGLEYAVLNINYRLCEIGVPMVEDQISDIFNAINHFKLLNPSWAGKTVLMGYSTGGFFASYLGVTLSNVHVDGVINVAGHVDFTIPSYINNPTESNYLLNVFGNVTYTQNPQLWNRWSTITYLDETAPPFLSFYFELDQLVPSLQGQRFHDRLTELGISSRFNLFLNENHFDWSDETNRDMDEKIILFLREMKG